MSVGAEIALWVVGAVVCVILLWRAIGVGANYLFNHVDTPKRDESKPATKEAVMIDPSISAHYTGDCRDLLERLPDGCVQTCITSPPYWGLRDYEEDGQIGLEPTPQAYVDELVRVFMQVHRVLRGDGTLWLNLGDSYARTGISPPRPDHSGSRLQGSRGRQAAARAGASKHRQRVPPGMKAKDLVGIPWMVAFALRAAGWYLRMDVIWSKPNPMPESVTDRPTKSHEYIFLLTKNESYYYDSDAISEPADNAGKTISLGERSFSKRQADGAGVARVGNALKQHYVVVDRRNKRSVWTVQSSPYADAHFATFPSKLIEPCVLAGSRPGDLVLDPFFGAGTTGMVAERHERRWIGFDLNPDYARLAADRTAQRALPLSRAGS